MTHKEFRRKQFEESIPQCVEGQNYRLQDGCHNCKHGRGLWYCNHDKSAPVRSNIDRLVKWEKSHRVVPQAICDRWE
jgi:hypothetical protein